jgi:hypothetical protein
LRLLRKGDALKITRLDRLGRSVLHLVTLGAELRERGVELHVIEQGIDTSTMEGRAMFGMLSVLAELQRELIVANTRDGLAAARARGRKGGGAPSSTPAKPYWPNSSMTAATAPCSRSPTSSASPAQRSTATLTRPPSAAAHEASRALPARTPPLPTGLPPLSVPLFPEGLRPPEAPYWGQLSNGVKVANKCSTNTD